MSEAQLCQVDNFEIHRHGFGSIQWNGLTDLRQLDLDNIVHIDRASITLYRDGNTPKAGTGLNKEAIITLRVPPSRGVSGDRDTARWIDRMREVTERAGNTFISYDMETWIFQVKNFDGADSGGT